MTGKKKEKKIREKEYKKNSKDRG
jgi:hypothetical protein